MQYLKTLTSVVLIGATALSFSVPAISAPLMVQPKLAQTTTTSLPTENVQYYRGGGYGRGYGYGGGYRGGRGYGHRGGGGNGALIGGLAVGALIGGAIAAGAAQSNAQSQQGASYCAQRYRSYDPASGTYLNNDGNRYSCP